MRAAIIPRFGGPDVFQIADVARPKPLPTEVLIRVHAAGLNPVEAYIRSGAFPLVEPPAILGWDLSGVVEQVAAGVTRFAVGDEVFGMPFFPRPASAYAEYAVAPSRQIARKPSELSHAEAAALPLAGLTAWQALVDVAGLQAGQRLLVPAAGGGVGHLAVQIGKALGAHVVATASPGKVDFVRRLGADEVIDYRATDVASTVRDIDVVFDLVGGAEAARSIGVLRPGGLLVTAVEHRNAELAAQAAKAGRRFSGVTVEPDQIGLERLAALVEQGRLKPHVSQAVPLDQVARAHGLLGRSTTGKIVLTI
jgi:NADPH:quinone reductase-like Zn-dependent oxidoreductase